ncbi:MAG TPA: hypothetical protein VGM05_20060 [Planctomycetaceae bacterium]|jgi:hypothetical protein
MTDRKKPDWAFWATVVLLSSPVLYVLSFGPAVWLAIKIENPKLIQGWFWAPLETVIANVPDQLGTPFSEYIFWWMEAAGFEPEFEIGPVFGSSADE